LKVPRTIRTYCPKCRAHTQHKVSIYRPGRRRALAEGQRRYEAKQKGYGSKRKPEQKRFAKTTKKISLVLTCSQCNYTRTRKGIRLRKIELIG